MLLLSLLAGAAGFALLALVALVTPRLVGLRDRTPVLVLAVVVGVAGAMSPGAPTRVGVLDLVLRFSLAAGTVYAGRYASRWAVLAPALLAVAASDHSSLQPLAFVGAGLMLGVVALARRAPFFKALTAGVTVLVAMHLRWPAPSLGPSLAGVVILAPIWVSGFLHLPRRERRVARRLGFGVAAFAGVSVLLGLLAAADARPRLQRGVDAARLGLDAARRGDRAVAAARLREAGDAFAAARATLHSPWAAPALLVPGLAPQLRALKAVSNAGTDLGRVGAETADATDPGKLRVVNGRVPIDAIAALRQPLRRALVSMARAESEVADARSPWLVAPIGDRVKELTRRLRTARTDADTASAAADVVPRLLGADGPRRYFIAMQNPAEARATGGIIGNFGEMSVDQGKLDLVRIGRSKDLNTGGLPVEQRTLGDDKDYNDRYADYGPTEVWQNVTMSPDFPTVARVISTLYPQSGGERIDGVVSVDPIALAALLKVVGPVNVPDWPEPITADNVEKILLFDQYARFPANAERVDFLGVTTETIWRRLTSTQLPPPDQLLKALGPAVRGKHLLLASNRPDEERLFDMTGASGRVGPVRGDYLGVITQDSSGTKIDYFLRRQIDYKAQVDATTGDIASVVKVTLHNGAPASGLPDLVIGNPLNYGKGLARGFNKVYLAVYTPWGFTKATLDGQPLLLESANEFGRRVVSSFVTVPPGGDATVEISFTGRLADPTHYRLDVLHQPTTAPDVVTTSVTATGRSGRAEPLTGLTSKTRQTAAGRFMSVADASLVADLRSG